MPWLRCSALPSVCSDGATMTSAERNARLDSHYRAEPVPVRSVLTRDGRLASEPPDGVPDGELRFRNPAHPAAKQPALAPAILSYAWGLEPLGRLEGEAVAALLEDLGPLERDGMVRRRLVEIVLGSEAGVLDTPQGIEDEARALGAAEDFFEVVVLRLAHDVEDEVGVGLRHTVDDRGEVGRFVEGGAVALLHDQRGEFALVALLRDVDDERAFALHREAARDQVLHH